MKRKTGEAVLRRGTAAGVPGIRAGRQDKYRKNLSLYLLLVPGLVYYLVFCYAPMGGILIAFKDYNIFQGILQSSWAGLANFKAMLNIPNFWNIVRNTLMLSVLSLIFTFPAPIILALMLNEVRLNKYKKVVQSVLYLPHFMSWVVLVGILSNLLSPQYGLINKLITMMGGEAIFFLADEKWWVVIYIISEIWKTIGWGSIIYLAALTAIDVSLYEAAIMDGANKWKQIIHITIPSLMPTVTIMLILRMGTLVNIGFEHPMAQYNALVSNVAEVVSTYTYTAGIQRGQYTVTTALGLCQSVINLVLVLSTNALSKRLGGDGLY